LTGQTMTATVLDALHAQLCEGDPTEPRTNVQLRAIENHRDDLLSVVRPFDVLREPEQESALRRLRERIAARRQARVPAVIAQAVVAVKEGRRELEKVRSVRRLQLVSRATLAEVRKRAER